MKTNLHEHNSYIITTGPEEIVMGLFGGVTLFVFEILPYLQSKSIFPAWDIRAINYGKEPDFTIIPGVFDLAYQAPDINSSIEIKLSDVRKSHTQILGNDWQYLNELWNSYFRIPDRIISQADKVGDLSAALGIHYRGTDKKTAKWDTNDVSQDEFIILINDFLKKHQDILLVFIATDEYSFVEKFKERFQTLTIINLGEVEFHLNHSASPTKADRALLDCLVLSRCKYMINTSSALSAFAKVLNPGLESYRIAASKLFGDIPYFPIAYIPKLTSGNPECQKILERSFKDDWMQNKNRNKKYELPFTTYKRSRFALFKSRMRKKCLHFIKRIEKKINLKENT
jgi:hypothetical protein